MITIKLEIASNGIIKTVCDNNYNGAGSKHETRTVYETTNDPNFTNTCRFLYDTCDDLGVNLGNKFDPAVLNFEVGWGEKYEPYLEEVNLLVKNLSNDLKSLKKLQKELKSLDTVEKIMNENKNYDK